MKLRWFLVAAVAHATPGLAQAGHDHHLDSPPQSMAAETPAPETDPHAGHKMGEMAEGNDDVGNAPAPTPPNDHAADAIFGAEAMAQSRKELAQEVGGMGYSLAMFDLLEMGFRKGREGYRFDGEVFTGSSTSRFGLKFDGEGEFGGKLQELEVQALYAKAIAPYWNLQAGVRHDVQPGPSRTHLVLGLEGLAPYWIEVDAAAFLSTKGEVQLRIEASHDIRMTQQLILQPRLETNFSFQDMPTLGLGSGLSNIEAGLRVRYELKQEMAPYLGIEWRKKAGQSARFARLAGEDPDTINLVAGIRIWF